MQFATLNYPSNASSHRTRHSHGKGPHRHALAALVQAKPRPSFLSNDSTNSTHSLPPIKFDRKRPSSIRVQGIQLNTSKLNESSVNTFHPPPSRSRSQTSNLSYRSGVRSRSISPSGLSRSNSKLVRLKFGHPVKIRSSKFYAPSLSDAELRLREETFVNDSIRSAHQSRRSSIRHAYEPLNDPYLRDFFQSSLVLDILHKTLDLDLEPRRVPRKKRSKTLDLAVNDYRRIVAKRSSGYAKLNGYDCIPSHARRHPHLSSQDQQLQTSADWSTSRVHLFEKKKSRRSKPVARSSPLEDRKKSIGDITISTVL